MKINDLLYALDQGMPVELIIRDRILNAQDLQDKYEDEATLWDKPRSRKRAAGLRENALRWAAHAEGLQEALVIIITANERKST